MTRIPLLILIMLSMPINSNAELLLSSQECVEKDYDYLSFGNDGPKIYLCDIENVRRSNIRLEYIFNYFIENCPIGFDEISDYNLYAGDEKIAACNPNSIDAYEDNLSNKNKLHARKMICESGEEEYLTATQFVFCY